MLYFEHYEDDYMPIPTTDDRRPTNDERRTTTKKCCLSCILATCALLPGFPFPGFGFGFARRPGPAVGTPAAFHLELFQCAAFAVPFF